MKIKVIDKDYSDVLNLPQDKKLKPIKPPLPTRLLLRVASSFGLIGTGFSFEKIGMDKLPKDQPALYLMNHSAFVDLMIAAYLLFPRPFNIVTTTDAFVGKNKLMHLIGCIPARKFVTDTRLVKDMLYAVKKNNTSVLMYPEASYSFDGKATPLPDSIGKCVKLLGVPVVMIKTHGAFLRDPLYNGLQVRDVKVSAIVKYLLSPEQIADMPESEINKILCDEFSFDNFRWQQDNNVIVKEPFRADGLNRVLYKCPHCLEEGKMEGRGTNITCNACGKAYELTEYGYIKALDGNTEFSHIPDWYDWERRCVKDELVNGSYKLDVPVKILVGADSKSIYSVGEGRLTHSNLGFALTGCDGKLNFSLKPNATYSIYSDYYWYEIGDMISIGDSKLLYYCFPMIKGDFVAKTRLAAEELYKLSKSVKEKNLL